MGLALQEWRFQLVDVSKGAGHTAPSINDDAGKCIVLTEDSVASPTVYTDKNGTALTATATFAVLTFTNGAVHFWTVDTVTAVDICGITNAGDAFSYNSVGPSFHRIEINPAMIWQMAIIPFAFTTAETDTGLDLPANCIINSNNMLLRVVTVDATETVDFGLLSSETGGDADGFIILGSVATAGFVDLMPTVNGGSNIDFADASTLGALLQSYIVGTDVVAVNGGWMPRSYRTDGVAKSLTHTGSAGSDTAAGYFYMGYMRLPF